MCWWYIDDVCCDIGDDLAMFRRCSVGVLVILDDVLLLFWPCVTKMSMIRCWSVINVSLMGLWQSCNTLARRWSRRHGTINPRRAEIKRTKPKRDSKAIQKGSNKIEKGATETNNYLKASQNDTRGLPKGSLRTVSEFDTKKGTFHDPMWYPLPSRLFWIQRKNNPKSNAGNYRKGTPKLTRKYTKNCAKRQALRLRTYVVIRRFDLIVFPFRPSVNSSCLDVAREVGGFRINFRSLETCWNASKSRGSNYLRNKE